MNIKLDKENKLLIIKDNLKQHFIILKFIFVLNLIASALFFYKSYKLNFENELAWVWLILGIVSIGALFFVFTRSTKEAISTDEISYLFKRKYFGSDKYFLKLKNGKTRNLQFVKSKQDVVEIEHILKDSGIGIEKIK